MAPFSISSRQARGLGNRWPGRIGLLCLIALGSCGVPHQIAAQDFERDPINYITAPTNNPISRLQLQLNNGTEHLDRDDRQGYLKSVLELLEIPVSSQTLVFSKTSLQRQLIAPRTPRAIYFNDDVYVGYCQHSDKLEFSTADPSLGAVFYTLSQEASEIPAFFRQNDNCLSCHGTSNTRNVPGHLVRSVYVDRSGFPVLSMGTHRIDHTSPINQRWGGWYVTGTHGEQSHLGNLIISGSQEREPVDNASGQNVTNLDTRFETSAYLSSDSDLVALMVLEHQVEGHNLLTRANYQTREALYAESRLNQDLKEPAGHRWESTTSRIQSASEALVKYLLFCGEAPLTARLQGTTSFAKEFSDRGLRDPQGRSLRDFDLEHRLFRYPCSYLIYSRSFDELPEEAKTFIWRRLWEVLTGADRSREFSRLSDADRTAILEILRATKPGLPESWSQRPTEQPNGR